MSNMLTLTEVADHLGLSVGTVSAYRTRGKMPKPDLQYGRTPLWKLQTIKTWRAAQVRATTSA
jgi:predicted site-specific integrase-resolvase